MTDSPIDDAQLMARLAEGRLEALGQLVRRHQHKVMALAYRMLGDWQQAEDVAQDAFLHVHRGAARYRPDAQFTTWMYRIATNLCLDALRRRKRAPVEMPAAADFPADAERDPVEADERTRMVRQAVDALPERQRTAVLLHRYEGFSCREIVEVTGWSESAVESLLVRAYAKLREALSDLGMT
jgi:RNA polymerase sigma-70 factor (ECF subfamily)